jgi:short chain dehydrogenase
MRWNSRLRKTPMKARPTPPRLVEMAYVPVKADLAGKVAVVAGANAGMGKATASELARMGAETVLACRNAERAEAAVRDIVAQTRVETVSAMQLDVSSLASVRSFARSSRTDLGASTCWSTTRPHRCVSAR